MVWVSACHFTEGLGAFWQLWFCVVCPGDCVSYIGSYVKFTQGGACSVVESHGEENILKGGLNCQHL